MVFFFQAEDGIRDRDVTGVQTCALPILRHSGDNFVEGGLTREELLEIARQLDALGIADYWMVSGSNTETLKYEAAVTPSHYHPRGVFNDLAALTKSVVRVPVIVAGRIVTAEQAEAALAAGVCD